VRVRESVRNPAIQCCLDATQVRRQPQSQAVGRQIEVKAHALRRTECQACKCNCTLQLEVRYSQPDTVRPNQEFRCLIAHHSTALCLIFQLRIPFAFSCPAEQCHAKDKRCSHSLPSRKRVSCGCQTYAPSTRERYAVLLTPAAPWWPRFVFETVSRARALHRWPPSISKPLRTDGMSPRQADRYPH